MAVTYLASSSHRLSFTWPDILKKNFNFYILFKTWSEFNEFKAKYDNARDKQSKPHVRRFNLELYLFIVNQFPLKMSASGEN